MGAGVVAGRARYGFGVVALAVVAILVLGRLSGGDGDASGSSATPAFSVAPRSSGRPVTPSAPGARKPGGDAPRPILVRRFVPGGGERSVLRAARVSASGPHLVVVHVNGMLHQFEGRGDHDRADPFTPLPERV